MHNSAEAPVQSGDGGRKLRPVAKAAEFRILATAQQEPPYPEHPVSRAKEGKKRLRFLAPIRHFQPQRHDLALGLVAALCFVGKEVAAKRGFVRPLGKEFAELCGEFGGRVEAGQELRQIVAAGGKLARVAVTMSERVTPLTHARGLAANLITATLVLFASKFGLAVSTTHVSVGSIAGVGAGDGKIDWPVLRSILLSWLATLPLAAALAWLAAKGLSRRERNRKGNPHSPALAVVASRRKPMLLDA